MTDDVYAETDAVTKEKARADYFQKRYEELHNNQSFRHSALDEAIRIFSFTGVVEGVSAVDTIVATAKQFEEYLRNGV